MENIARVIIFILPTTILAYFFSAYMYKIYAQKDNFLSKILKPIEKKIYKVLNIKKQDEMDGKQYFTAILIFSVFSLVSLLVILLFQNTLPFNPQNLAGLKLVEAFNIACSFITNTNWQIYIGEDSLSYFSQMFGITVQNFISAGVGIAVLFALMRGITRKQSKTIGNFWKDLIRIILYILLPLSLLVSIALVASGVVQTLKPYEKVTTLEGSQQTIPLGPTASQVAIKQLGSNGGGYFGTNSAYPLENPTAISNYIQCICILFLPMSLVFTFGRAVKQEKQGYMIFYTMLILLLVALIGVISAENLAQNYEGKEVRIGITNSSLWSVFTTAVSNGSINSMHASYTPLAGTIQILLMAIGEVVFGGVGSGLYTMIGFILLTVFIAGLMIGRTPEYLGKKIEPYEMKMTMILLLTTPFCILITTLFLCTLPSITEYINWGGPHTFTELLYTATATGANNGSSFASFRPDIFWVPILLGINMLIGRFLPIWATIKIAESLANKRKVAESAGTLKTTTSLFASLLILMILIIGGLSFFPALALGPIAEFL